MPEPCRLQLTDRTRYKTGTGRCACARYLGYHFGPTGYGIAPTADSDGGQNGAPPDSAGSPPPDDAAQNPSP